MALTILSAYMNPYVISAWLALSSIFVQVMGWWPRDNISMVPFFGYLRPLPAFAAIGVPILFLVDWFALFPNSVACGTSNLQSILPAGYNAPTLRSNFVRS